MISPWLLVVVAENKSLGPNLGLRHGWIIPGTQANSVIRNKMKRKGREYLKNFLKENQSEKHGVPNLDVLFIFRKPPGQELKNLSNQEFSNNFRRVFLYLEKKYLAAH